MRKVFIVTERRADYSRFQPILKLIKEDPGLDYDLVVTGLHLKPEHGLTIEKSSLMGLRFSQRSICFLNKRHLRVDGSCFRRSNQTTRYNFRGTPSLI